MCPEVFWGIWQWQDDGFLARGGGESRQAQHSYTTTSLLRQWKRVESVGEVGQWEKTSLQRGHLNSSYLGGEFGSDPKSIHFLFNSCDTETTATITYTNTLLCYQSLYTIWNLKERYFTSDIFRWYGLWSSKNIALHQNVHYTKWKRSDCQAKKKSQRTPGLFGSWSLCLGNEVMR